MSGLTQKRLVKAIDIKGLAASDITGDLPAVRYVDPASLLVDETYQRGLSDRSLKLILRIVTGWQWSRFKPPVVAETPDGLEVIDGQHTAIAAASHPGIREIPVMVVEADGIAGRASAFIGHNRDRLSITRSQMHVSAVAAGDDEAVTVQQVCDRAGVTILKNRRPDDNYHIGDTMALSAITSLISRRGAKSAREILQLLVEAQCAPVNVTNIRGVEALIHDPQYDVSLERVAELFQRWAPDFIEREAKIFAFSHRVQVWKGFAAIAFQKVNKRGGGVMV